MLSIVDSTGFGIDVSKGAVLSITLIPLAITIALYVLRSIGIYVLSKRAGVKCAWMGILPCVWVYPLFLVLKNERFFGINYSKLAIIFTVIIGLSEALTFLYNFLQYFPLVGYYLQGGAISIVFGDTETLIYTGANFLNPFDTAFVETLLKVIEIISVPLDLITIVVEVFVYVDVFKKYWPKNYILGSILSCLGLFGPFVFAIRKKPAIDFNQYMRERYTAYRNPYGQAPYGRPQQPNFNGQDDPFKDFSDKDQDPFSEFDNDKDK